MTRRPAVLAALVAALPLVAPSARGAERRPIQETDLFRFVWIADPQISPDGRRVAFVRVAVNGKKDGYDSALWLVDADGKTPARELVRLLSWIDAGWDIVIGSRLAPGACVETPAPLHRRLGTLAFTKAVHLLLGLRELRDLQCGLKLFRGEVARELFARQRIDGYLFDLELLLLAARAGYRIKEVGVRWRDDGDSRFRPLWGGVRILADLTRLRLGGR